MRLISLALILAAAAWAQDGCPPVRFSSALAAPLAPSSNSYRVLAKQANGSFTAFELLNDLPFGLVHTIPNFARQLRPCTPASTGLSGVVEAVAQVPSGGYWVASGVNFAMTITAYDAQFNLTGQTEITLPYGVPSLPQFVDVNNDGNLDVVVFAQTDSAWIGVALGKGGLSFGSPVMMPAPDGLFTPHIAIADVNGDHKLDIVMADNNSGGVFVMLGNGDGTFQASVQAEKGNQPAGLAVADLNGDGYLDLAYSDVTNDGEPIVAVALGAGNGTFAAPVDYPIGLTGPVGVGDINGDGIPDIVAGSATIFFGDGKGGFGGRLDYDLQATVPPAEAGTVGWIVTDFNADGIPDIVSAAGNASVMTGDTVLVLPGLGGGKFSGPSIMPIPGLGAADNPLVSLASGDLNGDGLPDLVTLDRHGNVFAFLGVGDGTFSNGSGFSLNNLADGTVVLADFNQDGHLDIAAAGNGSSPATIVVLLGNGDGTFQFTPVQTPGPSELVAFTTGDFNRDGKPDLALLAGNTVEIMLGTGGGGFTQGSVYPVGPNAISILAGDFHGTGKLDVVVSNEGSPTQHLRDGNVLLLAGKGDGTFSAAVTLMSAPGSNAGPLQLFAADFNRDGKLDLAVNVTSAQDYAGGMAVLLGGGGVFAAPVLYGWGGVTAVGDLNSDGIPDLAIGGGYALGNGDGTFQSPVEMAGPPGQVLADFNRDGKLDMAGAVSFNNVGIGAGVALNTSVPAPPIAIVSGASFAPGPLSPGSIATALGHLPDASGVTVVDSAGNQAYTSLLYASQSQMNFIVPSGLDAGAASVAIGSAAPAPLVLTPSAPAVFTVDSAGLVAGYVTQVSPGGAITTQPVFTIQNGMAAAVPIDVGAGQTYLTLFGTGLDLAYDPTLEGGMQLTYLGPDPAILGVDQLNVLLPASMAGTGFLQLSLGGTPVYLVIQ